jgi:hypothetical protein
MTTWHLYLDKNFQVFASPHDPETKGISDLWIAELEEMEITQVEEQVMVCQAVVECVQMLMARSIKVNTKANKDLN